MIPEHLDYGVYYPDYYDWEHAENSDDYENLTAPELLVFSANGKSVFEKLRYEDEADRWRITATEIIRDWTGGEP